MNKIYAVLVAYNPEIIELNKNLRELKKQVDKVVLCNNSKETLKNIDFSGIKIINFFENKGIAEAQSIGMKYAFEKGADFILQMDQDSLLGKNTVEELKEVYLELKKDGKNVGIVGCNYSSEGIKQIEDSKRAIEVDQVISSGSLISKEAYLAVGGMKDELFIDLVDFEYCWRMKKNGFRIYKALNTNLYHCLGDGMETFLRISYKKTSPLRQYYQIRNSLYLLTKKDSPLKWKIKNFIKLPLKIVVYSLIMDQRKKRLSFMLEGVKDGIGKKMGSYYKG